MQRLTELPNLAHFLKALQLSVDLHYASENTALGMTIKTLLKEKRTMAAIGAVYESYHKDLTTTLETLSRKTIDDVIDFVEER